MALVWTSSTRLDQRFHQVEESLATKMKLMEEGLDAGEPKTGPGARKVWIPAGSIVSHACPTCHMVHRGEGGKGPSKDSECLYKDLPEEAWALVSRLLR
mmetsp:Transcript_19832/g.57530  ORF Transcript_19832/g.57530 Transcript_19832/m.57530 type:complete len:99 (+) Transcript_19832:986-1282(+)